MSDGTTITRRLTVELTAAEVRERSLELSTKIGEGRRLEAEKKASASDFKRRDLDLRGRIDELSDAVQSGREDRDVECRWSRNDALARMELARLDSGEVIESRPLTAEERQVRLFALPESAPAKKRKAGGSSDDGSDN